MNHIERLVTREPVLIFTINKCYEELEENSLIKSDGKLYQTALYEATRKWWDVKKKGLEGAKYAVAAYKGITKEVFEIDEWYQELYDKNRKWHFRVVQSSVVREQDFGEQREGKLRWVFRGKRAGKEIRERLRNKSAKHHRKRGNPDPILYLNC